MDKKKITEGIREAGKAVVTGASMLIPGVSGGTMALIFGFYDKLISSVSGIFQHFLSSLKTILFYVIFVALGFVAFAGVMSPLTENFPLYVYSFFVGAILGGLPAVGKMTGGGKFSPFWFLFTIAGAAAVFGLSLVPEGVFDFAEAEGFTGYVLLFAAGLLIAVALVMPGISFSHMLLVLGLYEKVLAAVKSLDILYLLPIGIASCLGVLLLAKLLDFLMRKKPLPTFLTVIGFATASAIDIFRKNILPLMRDGLSICLGIVFLCVGFVAVFLISGVVKTKK